MYYAKALRLAKAAKLFFFQKNSQLPKRLKPFTELRIKHLLFYLIVMVGIYILNAVHEKSRACMNFSDTSRRWRTVRKNITNGK